MVDAALLLGPEPCAGCRRRPGPLCEACRARVGRPPPGRAIPGIARVLAPWAYEGAARALILALKLGGSRPAARPLADAMCEEVRRHGLGADVVTWVPGRRRDIRRRGFDHAELLARGVGARLGLACLPLLEDAGSRADQTTLGASGRRANLRDAFVARRTAAPVVLVDDVVTTGATAASCARTLRAAGAPQVEVLVACRA